MHFSRGPFLVNLKGDLEIFKFDIHRQSLIDSPVNVLLYLFSLDLIRKTLTQVFFDDIISIVMMSTEVTEVE